MSGYQITLLILYGLSAIMTINSIGKPRKPVTPGLASFVVVITAVLMFLVVKA